MRRICSAAMDTLSVPIVVILREAAFYGQLYITLFASVYHFPAGGGIDLQMVVAAIVPIVSCLTDLTVPVLIPVIVLVFVFTPALFHYFFTDGALLVVLFPGVVPTVIQLMAGCRHGFLPGHFTPDAADAPGSRLGTGGSIGAFHFFPDMVFLCPAVFAFVGIFPLLPAMLLRISDLGLAIVAVFPVGAVVKILIDRIPVGAILTQAAAFAHMDRDTVLFPGLHFVANGETAIDRCDTVANGIAVTGSTASHIPAVGQRIAQRQRASVFQIVAGHRLTGIIIPVDRKDPAGAAGVVKFTVSAFGTAAFIEAVAVNASPKGGQASTASEFAVDGLQDLLFRGAIEIPAAAVQAVGCASGR